MKPSFAFGATHTPHQSPAPYLAKHRGRYDDEFPFEGRLERVDIQLITQDQREEQATAAREGMARQ